MHKNTVGISTQSKIRGINKIVECDTLMGYKQPAKFKSVDGTTLPTKTLRVAEYLVKEIEEYARLLHEEKMRLGLVLSPSKTTKEEQG